jgi:hypothetical protein
MVLLDGRSAKLLLPAGIAEVFRHQGSYISLAAIATARTEPEPALAAHAPHVFLIVHVHAASE